MTSKPPARRSPQEPPPPDPWTLWFFRVVQAAGFLIVMAEVGTGYFISHPPRLLVVGTGLTMITGALGVERFVQWWTRR